MPSCTSRSSSTSIVPRMPSATAPAARAACAGSASQRPSRSPTCTPASRSASTSRVRKLPWTNSPRLRPIWSLRLGMIAVCGMGMPSGWRNRAVTANQSASAPTIAASAAGAHVADPRGAVVLVGPGDEVDDRRGDAACRWRTPSSAAGRAGGPRSSGAIAGSGHGSNATRRSAGRSRTVGSRSAGELGGRLGGVEQPLGEDADEEREDDGGGDRQPRRPAARGQAALAVVGADRPSTR